MLIGQLQITLNFEKNYLNYLKNFRIEVKMKCFADFLANISKYLPKKRMKTEKNREKVDYLKITLKMALP